jgi:hypothetical protein
VLEGEIIERRCVMLALHTPQNRGAFFDEQSIVRRSASDMTFAAGQKILDPIHWSSRNPSRRIRRLLFRPTADESDKY